MKPSIEPIEFKGLEALRLNGPRGASAVVSRLGGQVLSWITPDGREHLFLSERAILDGSAPIRGGIPVCFPQFGALDVEFCVENTGPAPLSFTGALHSYLRVVQVEDAALEGLHGHDYLDAANGNRIVRDTGTHLAVDGEVDRVYYDVRRPQLLNAGNLSLAIQSQGFPDVVVWNPWLDRCAGIKDMPADGWRHMLCVEAAIAWQPVTLPAGEEWYGRQTLVAV